ncbi:hypothetical protein Pan14r_30850 [Crateriforma conspicua]|uniref:Uncharacterized protein n=1 Tax=Crateriforma conspicua TaxID=2527996 RepID=A0A5C5Y520_9PLAN|nr:hypothetical protein Mal65_45560 [Crateriforma conspicua]TWT70777.1 hypothetical protein Pan14r_30850 [Crateriforma conspicua]
MFQPDWAAAIADPDNRRPAIDHIALHHTRLFAKKMPAGVGRALIWRLPTMGTVCLLPRSFVLDQKGLP